MAAGQAPVQVEAMVHENETLPVHASATYSFRRQRYPKGNPLRFRSGGNFERDGWRTEEEAVVVVPIVGVDTSLQSRRHDF